MRSIACSSSLRRDVNPSRSFPSGRVKAQPEASDGLRPETIQQPDSARTHHEGELAQKAADAPKTDALLSEQTVSNKEQRKADWAIIKEMSTYLWPKVNA